MGPPQGDELEDRTRHLRARLGQLDGLIVAFSGGVDSAFLLRIAHDELGDRCIALTATGPSLAARERDSAVRFAADLGVEHVLRNSLEMENPQYLANPENRCYFCKSALFHLAGELSRETGIQHVAIGTNLDDLNGHLPGMQAAKESGALLPLVDAGFTKADVRAVSQELGLPTWDKQEFACLSSRFPYGTSINAERLQRVEQCEDLLRDLGFAVFRVRFHDQIVRIELGANEIQRAFDSAIRPRILECCRSAGFKYVTIDLQGYRRGSMNE